MTSDDANKSTMESVLVAADKLSDLNLDDDARPPPQTSTTTTGLDLDRDVLSVIFSHLLDPEELCTVPCVCKHWKFVAEGEETERNWRAAAEKLGLGLEGEGHSYYVGALERRSERRGASPLPSPSDLSPPFSWKARVHAAWPELCFDCRFPTTGRRMSRSGQRLRQQQEERVEKDGRGSFIPRQLSAHRCYNCVVFAPKARRLVKCRLVKEETALRILRRGRDTQASSSSSGSSGSNSGGGNESESDEDEGEPSEEKDDELELQRLQGLLRRLPSALDSHPQDPDFRTVELFRRRDVRAIARGFWNDVR